MVKTVCLIISAVLLNISWVGRIERQDLWLQNITGTGPKWMAYMEFLKKNVEYPLNWNVCYPQVKETFILSLRCYASSSPHCLESSIIHVVIFHERIDYCYGILEATCVSQSDVTL